MAEETRTSKELGALAYFNRSFLLEYVLGLSRWMTVWILTRS